MGMLPAAGEPVVTESLIAPTTARYIRHSEGSALELAPGGRILLIWSRFSDVPGQRGGDDNPATLVQAYSDDGGRTWTAPREMSVGSGRINVMQAGLLCIGDRIFCFFSVRDAKDHAGKYLIESRDGGETWSERRRITPEVGYYTGANDRALRLKSGRILLPCHIRVNMRNGDMSPVMVWSDDAGQTWTTGAPLAHEPQPGEEQQPLKISEPTVIERADGSLLILCRSTMGRLFTAASTDGGAHWTTLAPSTIASKTAPPYMKRISDGRLILLLNPPTPEEIAKNRYVPDVRTTLQLLISRDDGATWSAPFMLAHDGVNGYCYPAVLELRQSKELLIFCSKTPETISSAAYVLLRLPVPSA